jgi:hypothetical protein
MLHSAVITKNGISHDDFFRPISTLAKVKAMLARFSSVLLKPVFF